MQHDTFNILMYSHDTYGLGHIRRTMAIATNLLRPGVNILILTGSPIVGRFDFPPGIDFVRIPGMIKQSNTVYIPHSIKVSPNHALRMRTDIITATAQAFDPSLFIVDKVPIGLRGEVLPTLQWFRKNRPQSQLVLGLRDILDDAQTTQAEWHKKNFNSVLRDLYDEIWIYGEQHMYDPIKEYAIPSDIGSKTVFTGYIPRQLPQVRAPGSNGCSHGSGEYKRIVVTTGGGGDGSPILDTYLSMLEQNASLNLDTLMIAGPFIPRTEYDKLAARAKTLGVDFRAFTNCLEKEIAQADLVISMGGYNTVCEILSMKQVALIIPRDVPRKEQLIRAEVMSTQGLVDYLPWEKLTPDQLRVKILRLLKNPEHYLESVSSFKMTGLDVMRHRLEHFRRHVA